MLVEDGFGESEIIAFFIVTDETKETLSFMLDVFLEVNGSTIFKTTCIMSDKDMTARDLFKEKFPNSSLLICLFHSLKSFGREITCASTSTKY